jgi:hypothetical protein
MMRSAAWEDGVSLSCGDYYKREEHAYLVEVFPDEHPVFGEPPPALPVLDKQVQSLIQLAVQAECVILLVRLSDSRRRPLDVQFQLFPRALASLCIARHLLLVQLLVSHGLGSQNLPSLRIANERLALCLKLSSLIAHQNLVVPRFVAIAAVDADISGGCAAVLGFALPLDVRGRAFLVVEVSAERKGETLVQALLVEEVCFLETGEIPGDEGWARDDGRGEDAVRFLYGAFGNGGFALL